MKLPNWLHRKPAEDYDTDRFDSFAASLEAENDALYGLLPRPSLNFIQTPFVPALDPYLNSLLATPTLAVKPFEATPLAELKERWAKANETLFPAPPESFEGARTRGYSEGYGDGLYAGLAQAANPEYSVEVVHNDDGSGDNSIDEVLLHDATRPLLHLERLDNDHWWMTLSPTGGWDDESTFDIFRVKKCIEVTEQ